MPSWLRRGLRFFYDCIFLSPDPNREALSAHDFFLSADQAAPAGSGELMVFVIRTYRLLLERIPGDRECAQWVERLQNGTLTCPAFVEVVAESAEAAAIQQRANLVPHVPDGKYILFAYAHLLQRSPMAFEIVAWAQRMRRKEFDRCRLALLLFEQYASSMLGGPAKAASHDPEQVPWMGTNESLSFRQWKEAEIAAGERTMPYVSKLYRSLRIEDTPQLLVSAIASLYRGGAYIEQFLQNITSQTIFESHCELIIIDADSPENEALVIARYMERFPNVVYYRAATRIGIYEAWNLGVKMARGRYLTNTNLDDLRRRDSLERQLEILEKFPFVDIVYQDFFYSFDGHATFDRSASLGFKSRLPIVTAYNLMQSNSPHNAPMWRQSLHDEIGLFDESFKSAGDYDFWMRCAERGKVFFKINDPHVIYFVNPEGLSTQPGTRGIDEAGRVTLMHGGKLISDALLNADTSFIDQLQRIAGPQLEIDEDMRSREDWRYMAVQRALRQCSAASRTPSRQPAQASS